MSLLLLLRTAETPGSLVLVDDAEVWLLPALAGVVSKGTTAAVEVYKLTAQSGAVSKGATDAVEVYVLPAASAVVRGGTS